MQTRSNRSVEKYKTEVAICLTHSESHQAGTPLHYYIIRSTIAQYKNREENKKVII